MSTLDWNKPANNNVGEDDIESFEIQTATNPHTQLDEITDGLLIGVFPQI